MYVWMYVCMYALMNVCMKEINYLVAKFFAQKTHFS